MAGKYRFLFENRVTDESQITASSVAEGFKETPVKQGAGSASFRVIGDFTGAVDIKYTIIITDVTGGNEIGQSTFTWYKDDVVQASGVATSGTQSLSDGLSIIFTSGAGNDFELNDQWNFYGINEFSPGRMIDLNRDTRYRSADGVTSINIVFDFGSALTFDSFALLDHNITSSVTTLKLQANATDSWGAPSFSQDITWQADKILEYFTQQSYQFVRLVIDDSTIPDSLVEFSNAYVGPYLELSRAMPIQFSEPLNLLVSEEQTSFGVKSRKYQGKHRSFNFQSAFLSSADEDAILDMQESITDLNNQTIDPVFFHKDSESSDEFWLVDINTIPITVTHGNQFGTIRHTLGFEFPEVVRSIQ